MKDLNSIVGKNLKRLREERNISLDKVADMTSVSKSMLGQIERGETNPTIGTVWKIARGLKVSFTSFLEEEKKTVSIISQSHIKPLLENNDNYRLYPIFPFDSTKHFEIYTVEIEPGASLEAEAHGKGVEEYITVFEGELELKVGDETYKIYNGESVNFQADKPHGYHNTGASTTRLNMLIYYPS